MGADFHRDDDQPRLGRGDHPAERRVGAPEDDHDIGFVPFRSDGDGAHRLGSPDRSISEREAALPRVSHGAVDHHDTQRKGQLIHRAPPERLAPHDDETELRERSFPGPVTPVGAGDDRDANPAVPPPPGFPEVRDEPAGYAVRIQHGDERLRARHLPVGVKSEFDSKFRLPHIARAQHLVLPGPGRVLLAFAPGPHARRAARPQADLQT
ncbi:MAG TPA: hypothetical protein VGD80_12495 [Kofleriaceae bacterium]